MPNTERSAPTTAAPALDEGPTTVRLPKNATTMLIAFLLGGGLSTGGLTLFAGSDKGVTEKLDTIDRKVGEVKEGFDDLRRQFDVAAEQRAAIRKDLDAHKAEAEKTRDDFEFRLRALEGRARRPR